MKETKKHSYQPSRGIIGTAIVLFFTILCVSFAAAQQEKTIEENARGIRIPIFLGYTCDDWVDQYGERMDKMAAEDYLYDHPAFACDIIDLNNSYDRMYGIANPDRERFLNKLNSSIVHHSQSGWDPTEEDSYIVAFKDIIRRTEPTETLRSLYNEDNDDESVLSLIERMSWPFNAGYIYKTGDFNGRDYASAIFYAKLAEFIDNGIYDELCADNPCLNKSIPVILAYDGETWYDQNGEPMLYWVAMDFFKDNLEYAREIFQLNKNQYYAPELHNFVRDERLSTVWKYYLCPVYNKKFFKDIPNNDSIFGYGYIIENMMGNTELATTLQSLSVSLQNNSANSDIDGLVDIINNPIRITKIHAWQRDFSEYVYWGTLAKVINSGTYDAEMIHPIRPAPTAN